MVKPWTRRAPAPKRSGDGARGMGMFLRIKVEDYGVILDRPHHRLTMASSHDQIIESLRGATLEPAKLPEAISAFQTMVWNSEEWESHYSNDAAEVLRELAYDLDFYEPDAAMRAEDASYYGTERAIDQITAALKKITASE